MLQTLLCDVLAALVHATVLDYNKSGDTSVVPLSYLLATHINSVCGLQSFALTQHACVAPGLGDTWNQPG